MTLYRENLTGAFPTWKGEPIGEGENAIRYHPKIEQRWSAQELEAVGLWRDDMIAPAHEPSPGKRIVSTFVGRDDDGVVRWLSELEDISIDDRKAERLAELAQRRWEIETAGVTVGELTVPSDRDTQSRIDQIVKAYDDGDLSDPVVKFKLAPGVHLDVDETTLRAIKRAGAQHIQNCFAREAALSAMIVAAVDLETLEAIDVQGFWA